MPPELAPESSPLPVVAKRAGSPVPPGAMFDLSIDNINEGKFIKRCNGQIRRAIRELIEYEKVAEDTTGKATITMKIKIGRMKGTKEYYDVKAGVNIQTPSITEQSLVKGVNGHLLVQPTGSSQFDPDQQVMFDAQGRAIGGTDPETMEPIEPAQIAGKIGGQ